MEDLNTHVLLIEDGSYGSDLKQVLRKQQYDEPKYREVLALILKLLNVDLQHSEEKDLKAYFTTIEIHLLEDVSLIYTVENKEVLARWYDVLLTINKKNVKVYIKSVQEAYSLIYSINNKIDYLVRAIALVKYAKSIFKDRLTEIFSQTKKLWFECKSAYYQQLILIELISVYGHSKCQTEFVDPLEENVKHFLVLKDFRSARFCVKSLYLIGILDGNQCNIRMAENYEVQGDQYVSEMQPNTYYPTISAVYLKGFRLIASANGCSELRDRLERKVADLQVEDFRTLQAAGVRMIPEIDLDAIHKKVVEMDLNNSNLAYHTLLNLFIIPKSAVEKMVQTDRESALGLERFFSEQVKITKRGAQVASQNVVDSYASNARTYMREKLMAYIYFIKSKLDEHIDMNQAMVTRLLIDAKSPFVPEDRLHDYSLGLTAGFKNDFVTAAYLLMPQLENSLRHLAVTNGIIVTTYEKRFQLENLLGGLIKKVRPLANDDIMDELDSFLVDNNNVNFRNELLHGLIETALVQKYGHYLWWLCLKMIVQTKLVFPLAKQ